MCHVIRFPVEKCRPSEGRNAAEVITIDPPKTDEQRCRLIELVRERMDEDVEIVQLPCDVGEVPFG